MRTEIAEGFDDAIGDREVRGLRALAVLNFVDSVRLQTRNDSRRQLSREVKRSFSDTHAHRRVHRFFDFDIRSDPATAIKNSARRSLHWRSGVRMRRRRRECERRFDIVWSIAAAAGLISFVSCRV